MAEMELPVVHAPQRELIDEITLDGMRVEVRCVDLPLDAVLLDPENPRVANTVAVSSFGTGAALQTALANLLWQDSDVRNLYTSILANKGLIDRIIVRPNGVVAEGNCRTAVYQKLAANHSMDPTWKSIPARVLPANITDKQVAILLGELHVGGKNKWSAFEKAGHIYKLFHEFGLTQDEIARLLRSSKTAVNHNNRAFAAMKEKYLPRYPGVGGVHKFSHFAELFKQPDLREWINSEPAALDEFVDWVGNEKIKHGAGVRDLVELVKNPQALAAFRASGLEAAQQIIEIDRPELTSALFKLMVEMTDALNGARLDEIQRVRKSRAGSAKRIVKELQESLDRFIDLCDGV